MKIFQQSLLTKYFVIAILALGSTAAFSQVSISVAIAPPPLQVYEQPACPDDGYIWTPGYWAYGDQAYYWVPGQWVQPPQIGFYWTPPYWGWNGNAYAFNSGYWGRNVGYYGGINYGYGYGGNGYRGGRWQGNQFSYNTAVNNVGSARVHSTYADRSAVSSQSSRVSYNGGNGGVRTQPTAKQRQFSHAQQSQPTASPQESAVRSQAVSPSATGQGASASQQVQPAKHKHVVNADGNQSPATHPTTFEPQTHVQAQPQVQAQPHVQGPTPC